MVKKFSCLMLLFFTFPVFAHNENHNWLDDKSAFESARLVDLPKYGFNPLDYKEYNINVQDFKDNLAKLSGAEDVLIDGQTLNISNRSSDSYKALARKFLKDEYQKLGFQTSEHTYHNGVNFVAEKPGTSGKILIISSHMDSLGNAGANDAGIGIISNLMIAKALSQENFLHTLRIIAFDQEERGLIGSRQYVGSLTETEKQNIIADIQIEMLGTNSKKDGRFHVIDCDRIESIPFATDIMNAITSLNLPLQRVAACTNRSDHDAFWDAYIPAIVISENFFGGDYDRCYHKSCDVFDNRLDFDYAFNIVKAITASVSKTLNTVL